MSLQLTAMSNELRCEQYALKLLAGRSLSESELRRRLILREYDKDSVDKIITAFIKRGYLDDNKLCRNLFEKYKASGKYALQAIITQLKKRELPAELINSVVKDYDYVYDYEVALQIVNRRYRQPGQGDCAKIGRFLAARGFTVNTIIKVLEQFDFTEGE